MRRLRRPLTILTWLCRLLLGGLLLYAAVTKWPAPRALAEDVANYRLLPAEAVPLGAVWLLGAEVVVGGALLAGLWLREAALAAALMMATFTVAVGSALVRGLKIDCGCFGAGGSPATTATLLRDVALLLPAVLLVALTWRRDGAAPTGTGAAPPAGTAP